MAITSHAMRYAQRRLTAKLVRAMPLLGAVVAIATVAAAMRRKGVINGAVDTALDFTPFVGFVKNAVEIVRGRDLFADLPATRRSS
jgi:hypothetical protein